MCYGRKKGKSTRALWRQLGFVWTQREEGWLGRVSTDRRKKKKKKKGADFVRKALCASAWEGWSAFPPTSPPRNNHSGEVAAKAAALIEETVTSCDAAAYTWHSSITYGVRRSSLRILFICGRARWKSLSIIWRPFYLGAASPWWNSERLCLALCDPCPLKGCQQKTTWNSPRA